jgi:6-phospho-3-hexuloisomerase
MAKAFAMRLMHIGYPVYVVGETVTPSICVSDVVISISGSGSSISVVDIAEKSVKTGAFVLAMTNRPESALAKVSSAVMMIPGSTKFDIGENKHSIQLLSSLFDQSLHVILDCVCLRLSRLENKSEEDVRIKHF